MVEHKCPYGQRYQHEQREQRDHYEQRLAAGPGVILRASNGLSDFGTRVPSLPASHRDVSTTETVVEIRLRAGRMRA